MIWYNLKEAVKKSAEILGYGVELAPSKMLGYNVYRLTKRMASIDNFNSLAEAYEQRLNEQGDVVIEKNTTRQKLLSKLRGTPPSEAYYIVQSLAKSKNVSGDVCEFGVAQGETSALIANEMQSGNKTLHLFDSFEGLPAPTEQDQLKDDIFSLGSMDAYTGTMSCPEKMVLSRLKAVSFPDDRYVIHRGFVEKDFQEKKDLPKKVSFAYVDFDFYEPIKIALEYLHNVTSVGSEIVVDDYDFFSTGAKTAVDEFINEMNSDGKVYECFVPNTRYGCFAVLTRVS